MRVNVAQATPPSLSPPSPHNHNASPSYASFPTFRLRLHRSQSSCFSLLKSKSTADTIRRSCSASFDGQDFPHKPGDFTHDHNAVKGKSKQLNFPRIPSTTSFRSSESHVDVLEPSLLGIRPEPPDWPAREEMIRECVAMRASSIELPFSLRMIKMKQRYQRLEEERESYGGFRENVNSDDPIGNLCCSTLYIIKEVQNQALKVRGMVLDEDLSGVVTKVHREMTSSFVWLFREVFAKTPDLMLDVMVLTSNFAASSVESCSLEEKGPSKLGFDDKNEGSLKNVGIGQLGLGDSGVATREVLEGMEEGEVKLWNSIVEEANRMKGGHEKGEGLKMVVDQDRVEEKPLEFISPLRVEIERDDYEEYDRTDLLYQIGLSQEPNSTLFLSNYAQFLCLVTHDYDRSEECFKRAIQLDPTDAEVLSQYANFLWLVRKDVWGAEERFQQAMAAEPSNSYHASKYANFLWSTGGEDTCYPLDDPPRGKS